MQLGRVLTIRVPNQDFDDLAPKDCSPNPSFLAPGTMDFDGFWRFHEISLCDHDGYTHLELCGGVSPSKTYVSEAFEKG